MRWKTELERKPYHGKQRVITKFALFPIFCEEDEETRWLEKVEVLQEYLINPTGHWSNRRFL